MMGTRDGLSQLTKHERDRRDRIPSLATRGHFLRTPSSLLTSKDEELVIRNHPAKDQAPVIKTSRPRERNKTPRKPSQPNSILQRHKERNRKPGRTPIGEDSDYDTDLEEEKNQNDVMTHEELYERVCCALEVTPATYFLRHMEQSELEMNYHGLGPGGTKALAVPLQVNKHVERLHLEGNWCGEEGARHVAYMLTENHVLVELNLAFNNLRSEGACSICEVLQKNVSSLQILDLSGNGFQDKDADLFRDLLENNRTLHELYLSHNEFRETGAVVIGEGVAKNEYLKVLDLSWNHIRLKGAEGIAKALQENMFLHTLNLSMNGFADNGAKVLARALKQNYTLVELDVSNNRISADGCFAIAKALKKNDGLEVLKIGMNPMTFGGAMALATAIKGNEESAMRLLDLSAVTVNKNFMGLCAEVRMRQEFEVKVGFVSDSNEMGGAGERFSDKNPLEILLIFMAEQNLRLVDLFKSLDKDHSMSLTRDEFMEGLKDLDTPLTVAQLEELINMLDKDGDGEVDLAEIMNINREHRDLKRKVNRRIQRQREKARMRMKAAAAAVEAVNAFAEVDTSDDADLLRALGVDAATEEDETTPDSAQEAGTTEGDATTSLQGEVGDQSTTQRPVSNSSSQRKDSVKLKYEGSQVQDNTSSDKSTTSRWKPTGEWHVSNL